MYRPLLAVLMLSPVLLAGCTGTIRPLNSASDVIRYHLDAPIERGTITVESTRSAPAISAEYQSFSDAVSAELGRIGFTTVPSGTQSQYIAGYTFSRTGRGQVRARPPVSIGIGGGTYSGGFGVGAGASIPAGKTTIADVVETRLTVVIRRRSDNTTVWEGHAVTTGVSGKPETQPDVVAAKLAGALFKGFPGESGITISVP